MTMRRMTFWRTLVQRLVALGLATLAPAVTSARVPYQSKPRTAAAPAASSAASASATPATPTAAGAPALPPGPENEACAEGTCTEQATPLAILTNSASDSAAGTCSADSLPTLGTSVRWMATPDEAGKRAEKERKLVFLIQVSGNFARQGFT